MGMSNRKNGAASLVGAGGTSSETNPRKMTVDELQDALVRRIQRRKDSGNLFLDLRSKLWGEIGSPVLFDPSDPDWPDGGRTTTDLATAERWIRQADQKIVLWIRRQLAGQDLGLIVADAAEQFITAMHEDEDLGPRHATVQQRRSYLRNHVTSGLGRHRLAALSHDAVQKWINTMTVIEWQGDGTSKQVPASKASREAALAALMALFRHHYPSHVGYPWGRIRIDVRKQEAAYRTMMVRAGRARELIKKGTYSPDELFTLMLTARFLDRRLAADDQVNILAVWAAPNLAVSMALQFGFASRIGELVQVRENSFDEPGFALIPGTKSSTAIRFLPIQDALLPWIGVARSLKVGPFRPTHYLLRTHPVHDALPNATCYARRMAAVQQIAGLKLPRKRTHIYRASHASHAIMRGIPPHEVKLLLGHSGTFGGATDAYIEVIREMTRPEHRTYLSIPSPEELDAELDAGWVPPHLPKRRKPTGRPPRRP
jgi:hypothetical protein